LNGRSLDFGVAARIEGAISSVTNRVARSCSRTLDNYDPTRMRGIRGRGALHRVPDRHRQARRTSQSPRQALYTLAPIYSSTEHATTGS
jgi:hypothetical protein